jgi:hypothetical protein
MAPHPKEDRMAAPVVEIRAVALLLRFFGILDLLALIAALAPRSTLASGAQMVGLALPAEPLPEYLARTASILYALHGAVVLFVSFDVLRYWALIRFMACVALMHGALVLAIDAAEGMPVWWRLLEGPVISVTGAVVLLLQHRADRRRYVLNAADKDKPATA